MSAVVACLLAHGGADYLRAARQAVLSLLEKTDIDVTLVLGGGSSLELPRCRRLRVASIPPPDTDGRAQRFLLKLEALAACLETSAADTVAMLDADTIVADTLTAGDIGVALAGSGLAMAEQTGLGDSTWARPDFLRHYVAHSLFALVPGAPAPHLEAFRFYNSGVVLARRREIERFLGWAREVRSAATHAVGGHMITDQDYFQVWANSINPGTCATLPWIWNHCEHWDEGFPRRGARILHFSNHCLGPGRRQPVRMAMARRAARRGACAGLWRWLVRATRYR